MIEFICDICGKPIKNPPEQFLKREYVGQHVCGDCIRSQIREFAKRINDAPLGYAPYIDLIRIHQNMSYAWSLIKDVKTPFDTPCPVCNENMKSVNIIEGKWYCGKCKAMYDRYGQFLGNISEEGE